MLAKLKYIMNLRRLRHGKVALLYHVLSKGILSKIEQEIVCKG